MDFIKMRQIALNDVKVLVEKGLKYGDSWKKRGGIGAFMMLARKTDRMEVAVEGHGYDIFRAIEADNFQEDGLLDDIADLRRYLFLVETEMRMRNDQNHHITDTFSQESFETYSKGVEELNDIDDKKALLFKAQDIEAVDALHAKAEASSEQPKAVPIYIDMIEIPPDDFDHLHAVKNSWTWTREEKDRSTVINWPSSYKALMCPAKVGLKWLYKGKLYTITEDSAPVLKGNKWVWEVLAIPDEETTTLEAVPALQNKADEPGF